MDQPVGYLLKHVQHALRLNMDEALRMFGLTTAQYAVLTALEARPDASNADLARACFVTPQTMIEILQGLAQVGFITRHPHAQNRRIITAALTTGGAAKLADAHRAVYQIEERMQANMNPEERRVLTGLLTRCYHNLTGTARV